MAKNFIRIDRTVTTAVYAQDLLSALAQIRNTHNQLLKVKGIMDNNWATTDFVDVETLFGIPTGQGQATYALVRDAVQALEGTIQSAANVTIIDRVG